MYGLKSLVVQINQYLHPMNENDIQHTISSYVHINLTFCYWPLRGYQRLIETDYITKNNFIVDFKFLCKHFMCQVKLRGNISSYTQHVYNTKSLYLVCDVRFSA